MIQLHAHAFARMQERGARPEEVEETIRQGEVSGPKLGRFGFRKHFTFDGVWQQLRHSMAFVAPFGSIATMGPPGVRGRDLVKEQACARVLLGTGAALQVSGALAALVTAVLAIPQL